VFDLLALDTLLISRLNIINEKFGPLNGFIHIGGGLFNNMIDETLPQQLLCYESSSFPFYQFDSSFDCRNNLFTQIEINSKNEQTLVYPNPANETIQIDLKDNSEQGSEIIIYDLLGKEVLRKYLFTSSCIISISGLKDAVYFYSLVKINQAKEFGKILVKHN
jgi:hypothetical protein